MMERLRAMREPLKDVQGREALLQFHKEMEYMGHQVKMISQKACAPGETIHNLTGDVHPIEL